MPAWLIPILIKVVLPFVVQELVKSKIITQLEADGIQDLASFVKAIGSIKSYHDPKDFPNPPPETSTPNNLNKGV